jgi:hypothetical protein
MLRRVNISVFTPNVFCITTLVWLDVNQHGGWPATTQRLAADVDVVRSSFRLIKLLVMHGDISIFIA